MSTVATRGHRLVDGVAVAVDRVADGVARRRESLVWLGGLLLVSGIVSAINIGGSPQRIAEEGAVVVRAFDVFHDGGLADASVVAPSSLGWVQLALYTEAVGAFGRHTVAIVAGREASVVAALVSTALLWAIARRLGVSRPAAAVVGLLFALSPLALTLHRVVDAASFAVPWLLASVLLLLARRPRAIAYAGAAVCFAVAVLTLDTVLLSLPVLVWIAIGRADPDARRTLLSAAGGALLAVGVGWILFAAARGELPVLVGGVSQDAARVVTSAVGSRSAGSTIGEWAALDPMLTGLAVPAAIAALLIRPLRPFGALVIGLGVVLLHPGAAVRSGDALVLLPFVALLAPAIADHAIRDRSGPLRRARLVLVSVAGIAAVSVAVATWGVPLRGLLVPDRDAPMRSAVEWIGRDVPRSSRLVVDDGMTVDLLRQGRSRSDVLGYLSAPAIAWRESDYIVGTRSTRADVVASAPLREALSHSVAVASWGNGADRVEVRRIVPLDGVARRDALRDFTQEAGASGAQLAANPGLETASAARRLLVAGRVDPRISIALGAELAVAPVRVAAFPAISGDTRSIRRQVLIDAIGGVDVIRRDGSLSPAARDFVALLDGPYAPVRTASQGGDLLITYPADVTDVGD